MYYVHIYVRQLCTVQWLQVLFCGEDHRAAQRAKLSQLFLYVIQAHINSYWRPLCFDQNTVRPRDARFLGNGKTRVAQNRAS